MTSWDGPSPIPPFSTILFCPPYTPHLLPPPPYMSSPESLLATHHSLLCTCHILTYNFAHFLVLQDGYAATRLRNISPPHPTPFLWTRHLYRHCLLLKLSASQYFRGRRDHLFMTPPPSVGDGYLEGCCCSLRPASIIILRLYCFFPHCYHISISDHIFFNAPVPS